MDNLLWIEDRPGFVTEFLHNIILFIYIFQKSRFANEVDVSKIFLQ